MNTSSKAIAAALALGAYFAPGVASAFNSGSTGADGAFSPTVNTTLTLPPSGIFNYTSVNIPVGVTVTYLRNVANTPVVILATGDVTISGTLSVSASPAPGAGAAGDGNTGDDGIPGLGGPGGFDGGRGGLLSPVVPTANNAIRGGAGFGPGGGGGADSPCSQNPIGGAGGGFSSPGASSNGGGNLCGAPLVTGIGGAPYGSAALLPLIGGSGGGGGSGFIAFGGAGGGGGGGAILIAASGTINVTGTLAASGGDGGNSAGTNLGGAGGGGSGGAIRLVATTIAGNGVIGAGGGAAGTYSGQNVFPVPAGAGAPGRIRFEAEVLTRTAGSTPAFTFGAPGSVFVAGAPTLAISSVAGVSAAATPTGGVDIALPANTPNPVTVSFTTVGVPVGSIVQLRVTPSNGPSLIAVSPPTSGTTTSATASVSVNLPLGPSTMQAQTTFTVIAALGDLLRNFAGNERVEKITLSATLGGKSKATLITVSGKEYDAPAEALRIAALGY